MYVDFHSLRENGGWGKEKLSVNIDDLQMMGQCHQIACLMFYGMKHNRLFMPTAKNIV